jgi:hypothetical protein
MNRWKVALTTALTGGAMALGGGVASADTHVTAYQQLRVNTYDCSGASCVKAADGAYGRWVTLLANGEDSPSDANARALVVHTPNPGDYTEAFTRASLHINKPASAVRNLSFDAYQPALQGGSPRIDVFLANPLTNGSSYVAIDAGNCQQALSSTWVRADATGRTAPGCTIFGSAGGTWSSDGTDSAWKNFVDDNPDAQVAYTFMVWDVPSGAGENYRTDRISLGTNKMFTQNNTTAVSCSTEAAC